MKLIPIKTNPVLFVFFFVCSACTDISTINPREKEKIWVYIEIETTMLTDTTNYYYYGQINSKLKELITERNTTQGMFLLSDIRYWNNNDLLQLLENEDKMGFKLFRIKDIQYVEFYKKDPVLIYSEELHESAKTVLTNENKQ